jgi:hypothetical protein
MASFTRKNAWHLRLIAFNASASFSRSLRLLAQGPTVFARQPPPHGNAAVSVIRRQRTRKRFAYLMETQVPTS